jgi:peptidoglycan/xylan/chitin deacetylase (PgdA/CDA1 family)
VVNTLDNGFEGSADLAAPILEAFGFTTTLFLAAGLMGQVSRWLRNDRGVESSLSSWATARELLKG